MKTAIRCAIITIAMAVLSGSAAVLPVVGNGTEPNKWTRNMSGVLSAAKTTNLPILLVMINDSSSGERLLSLHAVCNTNAQHAKLRGHSFDLFLLHGSPEQMVLPI